MLLINEKMLADTSSQQFYDIMPKKGALHMAKILIVEDEKAINHLIKRNLTLVGHECEQVYNGLDAIELIRSHRRAYLRP